jgi:hypothetical protein
MLGTDNGYGTSDCRRTCLACDAEQKTPLLRHRRAHHQSSRLRDEPAHSKWIEEVFGWMKTVGGCARRATAARRSRIRLPDLSDIAAQ